MIKTLEKEIERLKDDYTKLQEQFAQYQMASDKEIAAQAKQAVKEFAERLKERFTQYNNTDDVDIVASVNYELNELLKEYENGKQI